MNPKGASVEGDFSVSEARKRILVIDDQEDERSIQSAMLGYLGYEVRQAANGATGLKMLRESGADLVLLDVAMPRMDGFEVCRAIRSDPETARTPVLFYTASVVGDLEEDVRKAGGSAVLIKPVEPQVVAKTIRDLIGEASL